MIQYTEDTFIESFARRSAPFHSGPYGGKIPLSYMAHCADGRTRRVYAMQYGNSASLYVRIGGVDAFLSIEAESKLERLNRGSN